MEQRATIRAEHPRNTFYARHLAVWREATESRNLKYNIYKALLALKKYPLELNGIQELKQVNGIGDNIAVSCDAAWQLFCEEHKKENEDEPITHRSVKALKDEDYMRYLKQVWRGGGKQAATKEATERAEKQKTAAMSKGGTKLKMTKAKSANEMALRKLMEEENEDDEFIEPESKKSCNEPSTSKTSATSKPSTYGLQQKSNKATVSPTKLPTAKLVAKRKGKRTHSETEIAEREHEDDEVGKDKDERKDCAIVDDKDIRIVSCHPRENPRVILIADGREHRDKRHLFAGNSVVEHIAKSGLQFDVRKLEAGDYMWIAKKPDGSEMVLDWIVERKTWDDLHSSIIGGRYMEQKVRLAKTPCRSRIYLIEGFEPLQQNSPCYQALMTTLVNDGFMLYYSQNTKDTARFLEKLTKKLIKEVNAKELTGVEYADLQILVKKPQAETVTQLWLSQLMCFLGVSEARAFALARRFPSFVSLRRFVAESSRIAGQSPAAEIVRQVDGVNEATAQRIVAFFTAKQKGGTTTQEKEDEVEIL